jgi:hypothetical protein
VSLLELPSASIFKVDTLPGAEIPAEIAGRGIYVRSRHHARRPERTNYLRLSVLTVAKLDTSFVVTVAEMRVN